jgi:hypothetical protein
MHLATINPIVYGNVLRSLKTILHSDENYQNTNRERLSEQKLLTLPQTMIATAVQYVNGGLSVISIGKDKQPLVKWTPFKTNRANPWDITKWWEGTSNSIAL